MQVIIIAVSLDMLVYADKLVVISPGGGSEPGGDFSISLFFAHLLRFLCLWIFVVYPSLVQCVFNSFYFYYSFIKAQVIICVATYVLYIKYERLKIFHR